MQVQEVCLGRTLHHEESSTGVGALAVCWNSPASPQGLNVFGPEVDFSLRLPACCGLIGRFLNFPFALGLEGLDTGPKESTETPATKSYNEMMNCP